MEKYKYNVLTGLVHSYCKPYRTNSYFKAIIVLMWRRFNLGRGWISVESTPDTIENKASIKDFRSTQKVLGLYEGFDFDEAFTDHELEHITNVMVFYHKLNTGECTVKDGHITTKYLQ